MKSKDTADAIGQALLDYLKGVRDENITVFSDVTEEDIIPVNYLFRTLEDLPTIEKKAIELSKGKVLDVGGGSGVHSILLQEKGIEVKAIDISEGAVETMKKRGVRLVENINFFDLKSKQYDTLLFLMNGVGIAGDLSGLKSFLLKSKELLAKDGQILLDSTDIIYLFTEEDGSYWLDLNAKYYGEITYQMEYKNIKTLPFKWLFVDFQTLKDIASDLGYHTDLIEEEENNHYLASLTL